jgi:hypothetical protein
MSDTPYEEIRDGMRFTDGAEAQRLAEQILAEAQREADMLVTRGGVTKRYVFFKRDEDGRTLYVEAPDHLQPAQQDNPHLSE